jgi:Tol biopolymer transport system component
MHRQGFLFIPLLLGLIYSPCSFAEPRSRDIQAELVAVLNKKPANPLGGEVWLIRLDGRLVRRITNNNYHEEHPKFSPDGTRIAFVRNMGDVGSDLKLDRRQNEIFIYDLRTKTETRLTRNSVEDGHPEWSYDGRKVLFYSRRNHPENKSTVWIMASDGSHPRQVTRLLSDDLSHTDPVWAPDGTWLAFVNQIENKGYRFSRIEKIRMDGAQRTAVSSGGKKSSKEKGALLGDHDPAFSPDGTVIWTSRRLQGGRTRLYSFGAGPYYGGKAELGINWPVNPEAVERTPVFSPDGRRVVITRSTPKAGNRTHNLVLTDPQSSFRRYLTSRLNWDIWDPSWHPYANTGADREAVGTTVNSEAEQLLVSEDSSTSNGNGSSRAKGMNSHGEMHLRLSNVPALDPQRDHQAGTIFGWKLKTQPDKVISLALRLKGKLKSDKTESEFLQFQLMDWQEKSWVSVFAHSRVMDGKATILHEFAPANFIHPDRRQVILRVVPANGSMASGSDLKADDLLLEIRKQ